MKKILCVLLCAALLLGIMVSPAAAAEEKQPVLYLSFDEAANGTVKDQAGKYDASLKGGARIGTGLIGNALVLNGTDAYAQLPTGTNAILGQSYSVSVWVKLVSNDSAARILDFGSSDSHYIYLVANYPTDNGPRWTLKDNGTKKGSTNNTALLPTGQWAHVAVTCDKGAVTLYVNGNAVQTADFTETPAELGELPNCWLGRSQFSADPYLNGAIDELKIYAQALTPSEVAELAKKPDEPEPPVYETDKNVLFLCSDVHEYNDGFQEVFGYVVNEVGVTPDCALFGGDYVYHIGGNANQTEAQRAEVQAIANELSPGTKTFFYQGNHDNKNAAGFKPTGLATVNDYYVLYGINLGDVSASVNGLRRFLEGYNDNPDYAGKPLIVESHCPLDETRRTDHAGGTAPQYIALLNEYSETIDIVFVFGHSHTEEYENTFVPKGGTIDPENEIIGDSAVVNFTYMNMGFITNKDYAYSSGYSSAGQQHNSALKGPNYNPRQNQPGATAYELVRNNTADSAYTTQDTVFFWDVTSGSVITVGDGELQIDRYGYPADGTKENHPVVKLASYTVKLDHAPEKPPVVEPEKPCDGGDACPGKVFTDMPAAGNWAHAGIDYCVSGGLMTGSTATTFAPGGKMSRAMLATVLYRMAGSPEVTAENPFADVPAGKYYTDAVIWANNQGIVTGKGAGKFAPNDNVTRQELVAMICRYASTVDKRDVTAKGDLSGFADAASVGSYAVGAAAWAVENGILTGKDGKVAPRDTATRAEVAAILMRYCKLS